MSAELERILGRPEHAYPIDAWLPLLRTKRILVTGAAGSIGSALGSLLNGRVDVFCLTDLEPIDGSNVLDVRDDLAVSAFFLDFEPDVVFHLAGAKHAPEGERDPAGVCETNVAGTENVVESSLAHAPGSRVVLASTSKAANPETAYGASKLIAERIVLNSGGSVARFHNVVETSGNVFERWRSLPAADPLPVTTCWRYFISLREALGLLVYAAVFEPTRYVVENLSDPRFMWDVAGAVYPFRPRVRIELRRGDRRREPYVGDHETAVRDVSDGIDRVSSRHDLLT